MFGGDTLIALIRALGVKSLEPLGEALPGVAVSAAPLEGRKLTIVSKAGGFGLPGIAARIREKMKP